MTQPNSAVSSRAARDPLEPSTASVFMKYPTAAPERLVEVTMQDLAASGVPERALGRVSKALRARRLRRHQ